LTLIFEGFTVRRESFTLGPLNQTFQTGGSGVIGVIGPNGAGKTTLLHALAGFVPVSGGTAVLDDVELTSLPPQRRRIGYVSQEPYLFPNLTVEENVLYGTKDVQLAAALMAQLNIGPLADRLPPTLSGGEQQRVSLARALASGPRLMLFDEPFSHLDRSVQDMLRKMVKGLLLNGKTSALYVTHSVEEAYSMADQLVFMDKGQLVESVFPSVGGRSNQAIGAEKPRSRKFAELLGYRNFILGRVTSSHDGIIDLKVGEITIEGIGEEEVGHDATMTIRPEDIAITTRRPFSSSQRNLVHGRVVGFVPRGPVTEIEIENADSKVSLVALLTTASTSELGVKQGDEVYAVFKATAAHTVSE
jgi:molybdate/tungstate transport system ATP-binding protein